MQSPDQRVLVAALHPSLEGSREFLSKELCGSVGIDQPDVIQLQGPLVACAHERRHPLEGEQAEEAGSILARDDPLFRYGRFGRSFERVEAFVPWLLLRRCISQGLSDEGRPGGGCGQCPRDVWSRFLLLLLFLVGGGIAFSRRACIVLREVCGDRLWFVRSMCGSDWIGRRILLLLVTLLGHGEGGYGGGERRRIVCLSKIFEGRVTVGEEANLPAGGACRKRPSLVHFRDLALCVHPTKIVRCEIDQRPSARRLAQTPSPRGNAL